MSSFSLIFRCSFRRDRGSSLLMLRFACRSLRRLSDAYADICRLRYAAYARRSSIDTHFAA